MKQKTVTDITTMTSPAVMGSRRKSTYLQLHSLSVHRKHLENKLTRSRREKEKAEKELSGVRERMQILLDKNDDVEKVKANNPSGSFGKGENFLTY